MCCVDFVNDLFEFWYFTHVSPGRVRGLDMTVVDRIIVNIKCLQNLSTRVLATGLCLRARFVQIEV